MKAKFTRHGKCKMKKVQRPFMNAELETLRDNLECGHCGAKFKGSDSQARKVKYEKRTAYCSVICRNAAFNLKLRDTLLKTGKKPRKGVLVGPCKKCGKMFESKINKMFCTMDCYIRSDQFREMQRENLKMSDKTRAKISAKLKKGDVVSCLECGSEFYRKRASRGNKARKFCSTICYRTYLAKRFDRWVANPENLALPQCYDEFLDKQELTCLVDGCDWAGKHLSLHMNQAHGCSSEEFKRAAGFNLTTGVISKNLAEALQKRELTGIASNMDAATLAYAHARSKEALALIKVHYRSLEGKEHAKKARSMLMLDHGPKRTCVGCGKIFKQSTPYGRTLYCSYDCREKTYSEQRRKTAKHRIRQTDGTFKWE